VRALALVLALAVTVLVVAGAVAAVAALNRRAWRRQRAGGRWQLRHYADSRREETVVAVSLTLPAGEIVDEHVVARIPDSADDWTDRFMRAKETAEERAFHLNAGGGALPRSAP
jgi:hypothetical protein